MSYAITREEKPGKETYSEQTLMNYNRTTDSEVYLRRMITKAVLVPKGGDNFMFLIVDGSVKLAGRGSEVRTSDREEGE